MKRILGAISFLSRIPIKSTLKPSEIVGDFPAVGYLSGLAYIVLFYIFGRSIPTVIFTILIIYIVFNAFHFDGLLDTSDAFMSQKSLERKLEIMKMGNVGPMAVLIGVLYMITKVFFLINISYLVILSAAVASRYAMVITAHFSYSARSEGLGSSIFPVSLCSVIRASIYLIPFLFFPKYFITFSFAIISGFVLKFISDKLIGGLTGDVLGAIEEVAELAGMAAGFYFKI